MVKNKLFACKIAILAFTVVLLATKNVPAQATEINFQTRINIAEFNAKYVKSSWCIFSDGNSDTGTSTISAALSGESNQHIQSYTHRGKTYLSRNINWDSSTTKKSFMLSFHADSAVFSGSDRYDESHCSYKYWKGQSTSGETQLTAKAAFRIPNNVWAIRIRSESQTLNANTQILLSSKDYVLDDTGKKSLQQIPFYSFDGKANKKYFLTNASTEDQDNFVYLDLKYTKKTLTAADLSINFIVDFISAEECFQDLQGKSYIDLLSGNIAKNNVEQSLVNMACMLNPKYIKHTLSSLYLYDIGSFFDELKSIERSIQKSIGENPNTHDLNTFEVYLKLIDRVRFYYAYEILKESIGLLTHKIEYQGETVDSLFYIEVLRRRGIMYLFDIYDTLLKSINNAIAAGTGPFISLSKDDKLKFDIFTKILLPHEHSSFERAHNLIYSPKYLSVKAYNDFTSSSNKTLLASNKFMQASSDILTSDIISTAQARRIEKLLQDAVNQLRLYVISFDRFQAHLGNSDEIDIHDSRKRLLVQLESIFQLNINALLQQVGYYYAKNFEDPVFRNIKIGDTSYNNVSEFIRDSEKLLMEVKK